MKFRQDRMSCHERIAALFNYRQPDRVPLACIDSGFSSVNAGYPITTAYKDPERSFHAVLLMQDQYGSDPLPQIIRHTILAAHDFGGDVMLPEGEFDSGIKVIACPVKTEADILNLRMPDPRTAAGIPHAMAFSKIQEALGFQVWFHHRSPFTMAANMCDIERFARWLHKRPDLCRRLMRMAIDHVFNVLAYWMEVFGPDNVAVYNSSPVESNQLISPKHFEQFALPFHVEYIERLKVMGIKRYFFHICGDQNRNLSYLSDIATWPHPAILSFGHEVDLEVAARQFPHDIIYGNVDPTVIQMGTPDDVYELCRKAIEKGKRTPGGFILAPGCDLPIGAPPANVFAMTRAVHDFGWYN